MENVRCKMENVYNSLFPFPSSLLHVTSLFHLPFYIVHPFSIFPFTSYIPFPSSLLHRTSPFHLPFYILHPFSIFPFTSYIPFPSSLLHFTLIKRCFHKAHKQRVWIFYGTFIFRMKLNSNKKWMIWNFYNLT
jgi:hypothetical protein